MKNIFTSLFLAGAVALSAQTVSNNFESGNRSVDQGLCWGFGGFSVKSNDKISGSFSARSGSINNTNGSFWLKSPWVQLAAGNVSFDIKLNSNDGNRDYYVEIAFIPYDANDQWGEGTPFSTIYTHTFTLPHSTAETVSYPVPAAIAGDGNPYRVRLHIYNNDGNRNRRSVVDDWSIPGTYDSDPSNNCLPKQNVADSDGDGVDDSNDDFPNDPDKVYTNTFPAAGTFGTYAYEDLWPSKGDYDFNDLILDYNTVAYFNANDRITEISGRTVVRAKGGSLIEGFGIFFNDVTPTSVSSVTGQNLSTGQISNGANGTENGQTGTSIILCDDVEQIINRVGGSFFNTVSTNATGTSDTIRFTITFGNSITSSQFTNASVFVFKSRSEEIHMADKAPTALADLSLFGTGDDDSDPAANRYYKTTNNHPWAIQLGEKLDYPEEKEDIVGAYLNFANWAQSNGAASNNWYTDDAGNRNNSKIYGN